MAAAVALVMAGAARARPELRELLGAERAEAVGRLLVARATRWAEQVSAGQVSIAGDDQPVAEALRRVFAGAGASAGADADAAAVIVVWPVLPLWRPEYAAAVLDDLAAGCEASVAPVFDGGLYLLALTRLLPELLALPGEAWDSPDVIGLVLAPLNEAQAPVGLVRPERALRAPGDVRAALADPLLDAELRSLLTVSR